jgi:hypothetical protein
MAEGEQAVEPVLLKATVAVNGCGVDAAGERGN